MKIRQVLGLFKVSGKPENGERKKRPWNIRRVHYENLGKFRIVDYASIARILNIIKSWMAQGVDVILINVPEPVRKFLIKAGLDDILKLEK